MEDDTVRSGMDLEKCRICFEEADTPGGGGLISPCNCRGTQEFIHRSCLMQWQRVTMLQPNARRAYECSVCKSLFSVIPSEQTPRKIFRLFLPVWAIRLVSTSAGFIIVYFSRNFSPVIHILAAFMAVYLSTRVSSRFGMADGDPVPAVTSGRYLVADGIPRGSVFFRSVILILQHDPNVGSLGVIINNPHGIGGPVPTLQPVFLSDFEGPDRVAVPGVEGLFWGRGQARSHSEVAEDARLKTVRGVSGWGPRQLDGEVRRGSWKLVLADSATALSPHTDTSLWETLYYSREPAA